MPGMRSILDDLNRKYVGRAPQLREIGLLVTAIGTACGTMSLPARPGPAQLGGRPRPQPAAHRGAGGAGRDAAAGVRQL